MWIIIDFKINQDYIAKVLCINKEKPEKKCNGNCHLTKQLQKAEESEKKDQPMNFTNRIEITLYLPKSESCHKSYFFNKERNLNDSYYFYNHSSNYINRIFRPPEC